MVLAGCSMAAHFNRPGFDDLIDFNVVDSHLAGARRTSKTRAPPTESRWAKRKSGLPSATTTGPRMPSSSCPTGSTTTEVAKGGYILADAPGGKPGVILIASGSEVALCAAAHETLTAQGVRSRVVSMPSWEFFDDQNVAYRDSVLPPDVGARVSAEQASVFGWAKYVGREGESIGMRSFGASAPLKDLQREFGFTVERVVDAAKSQLGKTRW
jgi:transketolase